MRPIFPYVLRVDYVTAIATAALAVLTAVYVVMTRRLAVQATESAQAAARAADAAERALLIEAMPVVTPAFGGSSSNGTSYSARVRLSNEGRHAALNVRVRYTAPDGRRSELLHTHRLPAGESEQIIDFGGEDAGMVHETRQGKYRIDAEYEDPLGNRYRTETHQHRIGDGPATQTSVRTFRRVGGEWVPLVGG